MYCTFCVSHGRTKNSKPEKNGQKGKQIIFVPKKINFTHRVQRERRAKKFPISFFDFFLFFFCRLPTFTTICNIGRTYPTEFSRSSLDRWRDASDANKWQNSQSKWQDNSFSGRRNMFLAQENIRFRKNVEFLFLFLPLSLLSGFRLLNKSFWTKIWYFFPTRLSFWTNTHAHNSHFTGEHFFTVAPHSVVTQCKRAFAR